MPDGELGAVYWSSTAQQFYQEGRIGAVPRLEALEHLTMDRLGDTLRFRDERGHFVPDLPSLIPQSIDIPQLNAIREGDLTSRDMFNRLPDKNSYYSVLFTYTDLEGKVHLGIKNGAVNRRVDDEVLRAQMIAQIGADLDIDRNSDEGGSRNIEGLIGSMFTFIVH